MCCSEETTCRGLWVDDERPIPDELIREGWRCARSFHEAILQLERINFEVVSLDHDLASFYGMREMTGMDIVWWLVYRKQEGMYYVPPVVRVHSANPVGHENMVSAIQRYLTCSKEDISP